MISSAVVFERPEVDRLEAEALVRDPEVRQLVQVLESAVSRCAADPEAEALDERTVLKAVRVLDHHLTDVYGPDSVRAAFRWALRRLGTPPSDRVSPRVDFLLSDGETRLWLDLYPAALPEATTAAHIYLGEGASRKARDRWDRVAPRPTRLSVQALPDLQDVDVPTPRPSRRWADPSDL